METPNFYAIIPANVRYAKDLSEFQKLLYGEITALTDKTGYCWANNSYFSELYGKNNEWISRTLSDMDKKSYIKITSEEYGKNRKIYIGEMVKTTAQSVKIPIVEKDIPHGIKRHTPLIEKDIPHGIKRHTPLIEKDIHSNTSITNILNIEEKVEKETSVSPSKNLKDLLIESIKFEDFQEYSSDIEYLKKMLLEFYNYWSETKPGGKKERWQMEKTFDVSRRFYKWLANAQKWGNGEKKTTISVI